MAIKIVIKSTNKISPSGKGENTGTNERNN